jgi:hypothetical protein
MTSRYMYLAITPSIIACTLDCCTFHKGENTRLYSSDINAMLICNVTATSCYLWVYYQATVA